MEKGTTNLAEWNMVDSHWFYDRKDGRFNVYGLHLTREELDAYLLSHPAKHVYIFTRQSGNEPLLDEDDED